MLTLCPGSPSLRAQHLGACQGGAHGQVLPGVWTDSRRLRWVACVRPRAAFSSRDWERLYGSAYVVILRLTRAVLPGLDPPLPLMTRISDPLHRGGYECLRHRTSGGSARNRLTSAHLVNRARSSIHCSLLAAPAAQKQAGWHNGWCVDTE